MSVGSRLIIVSLLGLSAFVGVAQASELSLVEDPDAGGTVADYVAGPGEVNNFVTLGIQGGRFTIQDGSGAVAITAIAPCTTGQPGGFAEPRFASCPVDDLVYIRASLGDAADWGSGSSAGVQQFPVVISGGDGPDVVWEVVPFAVELRGGDPVISEWLRA
jgi:hypothetical protein